MGRTGHETSAMLARYRRAARSVAELGLGELSPLDEALPEFCYPARLDELNRARNRARIVGQEGLEPSANGLRVRCSTIELLALSKLLFRYQIRVLTVQFRRGSPPSGPHRDHARRESVRRGQLFSGSCAVRVEICDRPATNSRPSRASSPAG
jgi:hypothetical protein